MGNYMNIILRNPFPIRMNSCMFRRVLMQKPSSNVIIFFNDSQIKYNLRVRYINYCVRAVLNIQERMRKCV